MLVPSFVFSHNKLNKRNKIYLPVVAIQIGSANNTSKKPISNNDSVTYGAQKEKKYINEEIEKDKLKTTLVPGN